MMVKLSKYLDGKWRFFLSLGKSHNLNPDIFIYYNVIQIHNCIVINLNEMKYSWLRWGGAEGDGKNRKMRTIGCGTVCFCAEIKFHAWRESFGCSVNEKLCEYLN